MSLRTFLIGALLSVGCLSAPVVQEPSGSLSLHATHTRHSLSGTGVFTKHHHHHTGTGTGTHPSHTGSAKVRAEPKPTDHPSFTGTGTFPSFTGTFTFPSFTGTHHHHHSLTDLPTGSFPLPTPSKSVVARQDASEIDAPTFTRTRPSFTGTGTHPKPTGSFTTRPKHTHTKAPAPSSTAV